MPRFNDIINNFINGEISAKTYGRSDSEVYKRACKNIKNMIVHPQGGASRRGGSQFVTSEIPVSADTEGFQDIDSGARIIPFVISKDESYLLIFNKHQSTATGVVGYNVIQYYHVQKRQFGSMTITNAVLSPFPSTTRFTTLSTVIESDYLIDDTVIEEMQYCQVGNLMIFVHESIPPFVIGRVQATTNNNVLQAAAYSAQFQDTSATAFGPWPFMEQNVSDVTIDASATAIGACTLTASSAFFNASHVGTMFAFQDSGTVGLAIVTAFTSTTVVDATIYRTLPAAATSNTKQWYECAWSNYRGWPRSVAFWNSKLHFGGSPSFPERIWTSQINDIFEMTNTTVIDPATAETASDPAFFDLATTSEVPQIQWLAVSGNDLLAGSRGREYAIDSLDVDEVNVKPQTGYGSEAIQPVVVDDVNIYIQRGGRKLREIVYEERTAGYSSPEITFLAEHITRKSRAVYADSAPSKVKQVAYQALDNNILWALDVNGYLTACTKSRENSVTAWHRHELAGAYSSSIPKVISLASIPSEDGTFDELFILVQRTINSGTKIYLEKLGQEFYGASLDIDSDERIDIPIFVDAAKVYRTLTGASQPTFYARLYSSINATYAAGSSTGTATGSPSFVNQRALLEANESIAYDGTSNADTAQTGCIRFTCYGARGTYIAIAKSAVDDDNLIRIRYVSFEGLRVTIKDSTGVAILNDVLLGPTFDITKEQTVEFNYDLTNGVYRLFINGKLSGEQLTGTGTRDTSIDLINVGAHYDNSDDSGDFLIKDVLIWSSMQHTEEHELYEPLIKSTSVSRLEYLEGQEVAVLGDGMYIGDFTVSSGAISMGTGNEFDTIVVGLKYGHLLEPMPVDAGAGIGSAQGAIKRIDRAVIRFRDSAAASVGATEALAEEITFREDGALTTTPIDLVTDDKVVEFPGDYERLTSFVISGEDPLPCNVTCVMFRGQTYD